MDYGLTWLDQTFGPGFRPKYGWHIDPSGHSAQTPTVFSQLGYNAFIIARIPTWLKLQLRANQTLQVRGTTLAPMVTNRLRYGGVQFVWTGTSTKEADISILTHVLDHTYSAVSVGGGSVQACRWRGSH